MEGYRVLNVNVPVVPGVGAGEFFVLMREGDFRKMSVEFPVRFDEKIVHAAVNAKRGAIFCVAAFR